MQLHVTVGLPDPEEDALELEVSGFDDIDKIGARVASAARSWLRSVQVRKGVQHAEVTMRAYFVETKHAAPAPSNGAGAKPAAKRRHRKASS